MTCHARRAFTLVELVVVIAIIGMLVALLLPAVQASRESSRRSSCRNHLKQLGLGMLNHEASQGRFPTGGWGFAWVGDPDRGTDKNQPGGWAYCVLPYVEQINLFQVGKAESATQKKNDVTSMVQVPVGVFNCPSRRSTELSELAQSPPPRNFNLVDKVAQTDYAANAGDYAPAGGPGPNSLAEGDAPNYPWSDTSRANGICYLRSEVYLSEIRDGLAQTYLIGEKYVNRGAVVDPGDDQSMYSGYDYDTFRWAKKNSPPLRDGVIIAPDRFGSVHATAWNAVFCDGAVHEISYMIDPEIHRRLANRSDGLVTDVSKWQ